MKTAKIETKTFYHVNLDWNDIAEACEQYREYIKEDRIAYTIGYEGAFKFIDEGITVGSVNDAMKRWHRIGDVATCKFLAKHFGFDGVDFCGVYRDRDKAVRFTFYNEGADI